LKTEISQIIFSSRSIDLQLPRTSRPARKQRDVRSNSSAISVRDLLSISFQIRSKLSVHNLDSMPRERSLPAHYCAYIWRSPSDADLRRRIHVSDATLRMKQCRWER